VAVAVHAGHLFAVTNSAYRQAAADDAPLPSAKTQAVDQITQDLSLC